MGLGKIMAYTALTAAVFGAGHLYGPNIEYAFRGVPKEQQMRVVYSGKNESLEVKIRQGSNLSSIKNFAIGTVYKLPVKEQQLIAANIVESKFASEDKKSLVYSLLSSITPKDRNDVRKAELGTILDDMAAYLNPFHKKTQDCGVEQEPDEKK